MAYNYVCTAQKPTTVTHSLTGAFTGEEGKNVMRPFSAVSWDACCAVGPTFSHENHCLLFLAVVFTFMLDRSR